MKAFKRIVACFLCLLIAISVLNCTAVNAATEVKLNNEQLTLAVGKSEKLKLTNVKASEISWSSSNKSVATVNSNGLVTGIKKGNAKITATLEGKNSLKFTCDVTVTKKNSKKNSGTDLTALYNKCIDKVVKIETGTGGGTGFFYEDDVIVTNYHVIKDSTFIRCTDADGKTFDVDIILGGSEVLDIAILKSPVKRKAFEKNTHGLSVGESVYSIGNPMAIWPVFSAGYIRKTSHLSDGNDYILADINILSGNSGGPLFNSYGEILGITSGGISDGNNTIDYCVNIDQVKKVDVSNPTSLKELFKFDWYYDSANRTSIKSAKVGDVVTFGKYEQDNNTKNGKEDIEWLVVEAESGSLTLLSLKGIEALPYNDENEETSWAKCSLRKFLNNDFIKTAFSESEKKKLNEVTLKNPAHSMHGTKGGADTKDTVWIPSEKDINNWFNVRNGGNDEKLICLGTAYAFSKGLWVERPGTDTCWWWVRTPGATASDALEVSAWGWFSIDGSNVATVNSWGSAEGKQRSVRPVIKISR